MTFLKPTAKWPNWLITLRMPEFWNYRIIYFFVLFWLTFKVIFGAKGRFYPFALNRIIDESGGFSGASKGLINKQFDQGLFPKTLFLKHEDVLEAKEIITQSFDYPFILKPTHLNRGVAVLKINNESDLDRYLKQTTFDFQAEEYLNQGIEVAVFIANPLDEPLKILSITGKEFLSVEGDGIQSIHALLKKNWRYNMFAAEIKPFWKNKWDRVPAKKEQVLIQPIGNHNKGTRFIDESHRISPEMEAYFQKIVPQSIQYGRFDIKVENWNGLCTGEGLKIIEFNGTIAEPVNYLDEKYGYFDIQRIMFKHYKWQYKIAKQMLDNGFYAPSFVTGWRRTLEGSRFRKKLKDIRID